MPLYKDNLPRHVVSLISDEGWSDSETLCFLEAVNRALDSGEDEQKAVQTGTAYARQLFNDDLTAPSSDKARVRPLEVDRFKIKKPSTSIDNALQKPKVYYCKHIQSGVAGYEDGDVLVTMEALKKMAKSFKGCPVYVNHQEVKIERIQEDSDGYITDCFYNKDDGWWYAKFIVVSDKGHKAIAEGWSVSNAYMVTQWGDAGTENNVPYTGEVLDGYYTHMAIVDTPRYEGAEILTEEAYTERKAQLENDLKELSNSKKLNKRTIGEGFMSLFRKEKVADIEPDTLVELKNGRVVKLQELINIADKCKDDEKENKGMHGGMKLNEMPDEFQNMSFDDVYNEMYPDKEKKENMVDEDEEKENEVDEEDKEEEVSNADDMKDMMREMMKEMMSEMKNESDKEEEVANSKFYKGLKNAKSTETEKPAYVTMIDREAIGKARY